MKPRNILLPIDIAACPMEVFSFVNQLPGQPIVTLLHVLTLNVWAPENRLYDQATRDAQETLSWLGDKFLSPRLDLHISIRWGKPCGEIVAAAAESKADLIVLANHRDLPRRHRFFHVPVLESVVKTAPCPVSVVSARTRFDCRMQWGRDYAAAAAGRTAPSWTLMPAPQPA